MSKWIDEAPEELNGSDRREFWSTEWQHGYDYYRGRTWVGRVASDISAPANTNYKRGYRVVDERP